MIWRVVCQEHATFTASLCNAGLGSSWSKEVVNNALLCFCYHLLVNKDVYTIFRKFTERLE